MLAPGVPAVRPVSPNRFHDLRDRELDGLAVNPYVNWRDLAAYEFDLPPLDEQRRIADLLWAVERHRAHRAASSSSCALR